MVHSRAVRLVKDYIFDMKPPDNEWVVRRFNERSLYKWAAEEILHELVNKPDEDSICVLEQFISKMETYANLNDSIGYIFLAVAEIGTEILNIFYIYEAK